MNKKTNSDIHRKLETEQRPPHKKPGQTERISRSCSTSDTRRVTLVKTTLPYGTNNRMDQYEGYNGRCFKLTWKAYFFFTLYCTFCIIILSIFNFILFRTGGVLAGIIIGSLLGVTVFIAIIVTVCYRFRIRHGSHGTVITTIPPNVPYAGTCKLLLFYKKEELYALFQDSSLELSFCAIWFIAVI